jgi:hypothetical protein
MVIYNSLLLLKSLPINVINCIKFYVNCSALTGAYDCLCLFVCLCLMLHRLMPFDILLSGNHNRVLAFFAAINPANECAACQQSCDCHCVYQSCDNHSTCEPGGTCRNHRRFFELLCGRLVKYLHYF